MCTLRHTDDKAVHNDRLRENHRVQSETDLEAAIVGVHLIDFAHVFPSSQIDENVLFGIRSLLSHLDQLLKM